MNRTFLIIDTAHMLHRARHVTSGDIWTQTGLSLHVLLSSIKKCWKMFEADHVVFALEGRSWRRELYTPYKRNRDADRSKKSPTEIESDAIFNEGVNAFIKFVQDHSNCTILQNEICEADDCIARWIHNHPNDNHVIVSGDTDFIQLLKPNVQIYDGVKNIIIKPEGIFSESGKPVHFQVQSNTKLKVLKEAKKNETVDVPEDWIEWHLFLKCIRGDSSDNIFSAYPRANLNKIKNAFKDRHNKGYDWHNFMMTRWEDHNDESHRVKECYALNQELIDLTKQPEEIKDLLDQTVTDAISEPKSNKQIGVYFLKFAGEYELNRIADHPKDFLDFLSAKY